MRATYTTGKQREARTCTQRKSCQTLVSGGVTGGQIQLPILPLARLQPKLTQSMKNQVDYLKALAASPVVFMKSISGFCVFAGAYGFALAIKSTYEVVPFVHAYRDKPFSSRFVKINTSYTSCVGGILFGIFRVFRLRNHPKIINPVIGPVSIYMVNMPIRKNSVDNQPNYSMGLKHLAVYRPRKVSRAYGIKSSFSGVIRVKLLASAFSAVSAGVKQIRRSFAPKKFTSLGVIPQDRFNKLIGGKLIIHPPMVYGG